MNTQILDLMRRTCEHGPPGARGELQHDGSLRLEFPPGSVKWAWIYPEGRVVFSPEYAPTTPEMVTANWPDDTELKRAADRAAQGR